MEHLSATPSPADRRTSRPGRTGTTPAALSFKEEKRREERNKLNPRSWLKGAALERFDVIVDTLKRNGIDAERKGLYLVEATRLAYPAECPEIETLSEAQGKQLIRSARSVMYYCIAGDSKRDKINERFIEIQDEVSGPTTAKAIALFIGAAIS